MARDYNLGPVKPHVASAAKEIGERFKVGTIYGFAQRTYSSDHPLGLALDLMVYGDRAKGDAIAAYAQANAQRLGITYIIWYQRIWSVDRANEGWRQMENRGSITANHMDHPHISFEASVPGTVPIGVPIIPPYLNPLNPDNPLPGPLDTAGTLAELYNAAKAFSNIGLWFNTPQNILRVNLFVIGVILMFAALIKATKSSGAVKNAAQNIGKVAANAKS